MGKLGAYLRPAPAGKTKTVYLENFKDEEGNPLPFVVKSISPKENEILVRRYSDEKGNLDGITYGNQLIAMCLVEPNLKDTELCTFYGVMDPADVPSIMFSVGEKQIIQDAISEINDIKAAQNVLKMAKNS